MFTTTNIIIAITFIFSILGLVSFIFSYTYTPKIICSDICPLGAQGPMGPTGPAGKDGNLNITEGNVIAKVYTKSNIDTIISDVNTDILKNNSNINSIAGNINNSINAINTNIGNINTNLLNNYSTKSELNNYIETNNKTVQDNYNAFTTYKTSNDKEINDVKNSINSNINSINTINSNIGGINTNLLNNYSTKSELNNYIQANNDNFTTYKTSNDKEINDVKNSINSNVNSINTINSNISGINRNLSTNYYTKNNINDMISKTMPIGTIIPYSGSTISEYFLPCNGQAISKIMYNQLFDVIGYTYSANKSGDNFNVPNIKGKTIIGPDTGYLLGGIGGSASKSISTKGTIKIDNIPAHTHSATARLAGAHTHTSSAPVEAGLFYQGDWIGYVPSDGALVRNSNAGSRLPNKPIISNISTAPDHTHIIDVGNTGGNTTGGANEFTANGTADVMQPYIVLNYIIKCYEATPTTSSNVSNNVKIMENENKVEKYSYNSQFYGVF